MTVSINGRKVHEAPIAAECDPWLALLCPATQAGSARKIAISGTPQVPEQLNLSALPDLTGWRSDEYAETTTGDNADWEKRGEEIVGRLIEDIPGAKQESVLRYHRPMLEDGRIAYEFYYEPGKAMVHPSLDRLAFLLEPDGVQVHRLTDGAYERTGLAPDNVIGRAGEPPRSVVAPPQAEGVEPAVGRDQGRQGHARAQRPVDLRADPRADQPPLVRPVPLRRRHPGPRAQRDLPGRMAPVAAGELRH